MPLFSNREVIFLRSLNLLPLDENKEKIKFFDRYLQSHQSWNNPPKTKKAVTKNIRNCLIMSVGATGFEPVTPCL